MFRPAVVPGTNLTDLQAAGLVEADTSATYEDSFASYKRLDFIYRVEFEGGDEAGREHVFLCFDGLDTLCDIFLNDEWLGGRKIPALSLRCDQPAAPRHQLAGDPLSLAHPGSGETATRLRATFPRLIAISCTSANRLPSLDGAEPVRHSPT